MYFALADRGFVAFDSPIRHEFDFTPSMSIFVRCEDEEQVRLLFAQIASDGDVKMAVDDYGFSSAWLGHGSLRRVAADRHADRALAQS